jgi:protein-tyrosine phosphatase
MIRGDQIAGASVKYAVSFLLMACMAASAAMMAASALVRIELFFATGSLLVVTTAYALNRPSLLLKRPNGSRGPWAWTLLGPYYGLVGLSFWTYRLINRRDASTEVSPGVWLSRRLTAGEVRKSGIEWAAVVDLAAEFPRVPLLSAAYLSLRVLDGSPPTVEQLRRGVEWIDKHRDPRGPVLVHCALGHGRSASMVIAWMIASGIAADVEKGLAAVRAVRPGVGLTPGQMRRSQEFCVTRNTPPPA